MLTVGIALLIASVWCTFRMAVAGPVLIVAAALLRLASDFLLRMEPEVWVELERLAAQELRSTNGQVEYLLREGLSRRGRAPARRKREDR